MRGPYIINIKTVEVEQNAIFYTLFEQIKGLAWHRAQGHLSLFHVGTDKGYKNLMVRYKFSYVIAFDDKYKSFTPRFFKPMRADQMGLYNTIV